MNAFMIEMFAIFGMFFSFGLLVAGLLKTVRYFSEMNAFKKCIRISQDHLHKQHEKLLHQNAKIEKEIEVLGKCNNTNRDSQKEIKEKVEELFKFLVNAEKKVSKLDNDLDNHFKASVNMIEIIKKLFDEYEQKTEQRTSKLEERIDELSAMAQ